MALRIRVTSPVYCGKRRGLLQTCIIRRPNGRARLKAPKLMLVSCPSCGKPYSNPFSHVCTPLRAGDFKRRKAAAEKRAKAAKPKLQRPAHDYATLP